MPTEPPRIQLCNPLTRRVEPLEPRMVVVRDTPNGLAWKTGSH